MYVIEKRKNYIRRILRLSRYEELLNNSQKDQKLVSKITIWLEKNNINIEVEEFAIITSILMAIIVIIGIILRQSHKELTVQHPSGS